MGMGGGKEMGGSGKEQMKEKRERKERKWKRRTENKSVDKGKNESG